MPPIILPQIQVFLECSPFFDSNLLICFVSFHRTRKYSRSTYSRKRRYTSQFLKYSTSVHIIQQQKLGSRLQWDLIETSNKIAESAVLCCSQQNRDLLDLHIVVTDFFFQPTWPVEFEIQPVAFLIRWRCEFGAMLAGYRQQPGCFAIVLIIVSCL